jgi:hypothetical protein
MGGRGSKRRGDFGDVAILEEEETLEDEPSLEEEVTLEDVATLAGRRGREYRRTCNDFSGKEEIMVDSGDFGGQGDFGGRR